MPHFGLPELLVIPFVLLSAALPIVGFVLVVLTYRKVSSIEENVARLLQRPPA